jgi:meiotically up-regulated gene 157 (Mug157) protein
VNTRSILALVVAVSLIPGTHVNAAAEERGALSDPVLRQLYVTANDEAISRHAFAQRDGTTFVSTGDIPAEWLRDGSAIADAYVGQARSDAAVARTLKGVIARQAREILIDPYANAFSPNYRVFEEKFEVDSLLYPIWFAHDYWSRTGDASPFDARESAAFDRVLHVLGDEQHHAERSKYRHAQLERGGRGTPVAYTGMVWTGFRPSDDRAQFHYNVPENMFAAVTMRRLATIEREVYHDARKAGLAAALAETIRRGIETYGRVDVPGAGRVYAYEVDGLGNASLMDDANVPSLLSSPYFGYVRVDDPTYRATRAFVLSNRNPYFYSGSAAQGIGSPHTPPGYVWPLALVMQALTATDPAEIDRVLGYIAASDAGDHLLHESFDAGDPQKFTRADFAWPNALYTELIRTQPVREAPAHAPLPAAIGPVSKIDVEDGEQRLVGARQEGVERDARPEIVHRDPVQTKEVVQDHRQHQGGQRHRRQQRHPNQIAAAPRKHGAAEQRKAG